MIQCETNIDLIIDSENIGDSLPKINNNFENLESLAKNIRNEINISKNVRTFFYYGPNAPANDSGTSGMNNNTTTRPSNTTIQNFINNSLGLSAPDLSKTGDIVYVIYQKTGWYAPDPITYTVTESGLVEFNNQEAYTIANTVFVPNPTPPPPPPPPVVQFSKQEPYTVATTRRIGIGGKCFAAGTIIQTPRGLIPIEDLVIGDEVFSFDPITLTKYVSKITKTFKNSWEQNYKDSPLLEIMHEKGVLYVVEGHWLYEDINNKIKYKEAKQFKVGEYLSLDSNIKSAITSIKQNQKYDWVYNLSVNQYHNFIADNVLVGDYDVDKETILLDSNFKQLDNGIVTANGIINEFKLNVGDKIYGYDSSNLYLQEQEITNVQKTKQSFITITHEQGELSIPEEQKVLIKDVYIPAKELQVGQELTVLEKLQFYHPHFDTISKILKIEKKPQQDSIILTVNNTHNYILNNVFVHNGGGGSYVTTYETRFRTIYTQKGYSWTANISDTYNIYAPVFVIYKLIYNGIQYLVDPSYPKYTYATTGSTINWNNPQTWPTY
jgi:hypothetical protein